MLDGTLHFTFSLFVICKSCLSNNNGQCAAFRPVLIGCTDYYTSENLLFQVLAEEWMNAAGEQKKLKSLLELNQ